VVPIDVFGGVRFTLSMVLSLEMKIYLASVSLIYGFFVLWFLTRSKLVLARKIKTVMKRTQMRATLETGPSVDEDQLKEEAVERIESRFSNIRRLVIPIVTSIYSLLVFIPFLGYVPGTYLSIVVGSIGFTIGIAAKPYVENLISGLIMSYGRSVRIGDTVEIDNQYGTVEDIALTYTVVKVWDWKRYIIPNALVLQ
jgi:small-conductance mechanosensitive channel